MFDNRHRSPAQLTPEAITETYNRHPSPAVEEETTGPRQYHPTPNNEDMLLSLPSMDHVSHEHIDQENLAHVAEVSTTVADNVTHLARTIETQPLFPQFKKLKLPPTPVINAWVQRYFEHVHPVFPLLHKTSFRAPETHWLLIFTVSAIGAQFSTIPQARLCGGTMQEIARRQGLFLALRYSGDRRCLESAEIYGPPIATVQKHNVTPKDWPRWICNALISGTFGLAMNNADELALLSG
ncbi:uncharacterized protein LDX57_003792 [Aspergillus melleus]|uniref:uncharacterized protein n=1 Tax=Aspergillus melleus TaxID=138277 RepID=UPI001E8DD160|nr:uncharacterized protein LDX57_003792 [Aspergillus melleus]KAH8426052.1 hypothetical protein LDX57_003792 [Aspergillus melleus]